MPGLCPRHLKSSVHEATALAEAGMDLRRATRPGACPTSLSSNLLRTAIGRATRKDIQTAYRAARSAGRSPPQPGPEARLGRRHFLPLWKKIVVGRTVESARRGSTRGSSTPSPTLNRRNMVRDYHTTRK